MATENDSTNERFLSLLVVANPKDRFRAMNIRRDRGVEAAIEYLGECNITDEPYDNDDELAKRRPVNLVLESFGENKIAVIKIVKDYFNIGLSDAKNLVESAPCTLLKEQWPHVADDLRRQLERAGASVRFDNGTVQKLAAIASEAAEKTRQIADDDEKLEITVLVGDLTDALYGLHGIVEALVDLEEPKGFNLALAARALTKRLYGALGNLTPDVEERIEAAGVKVYS